MPSTKITCPPHSPSYNPDMLEHSIDCECESCLADVAAFNAKKAQRAARKAKRESGVEATFTKEHEAQGKLVLKVKVLGRPGYPDRWVLGDIEAMCAAILKGPSSGEQLRDYAERLLATVFSMAELKKQKQSRFQPKQKTIIPMLRERGFKVDIKHG